MLDRHEPTTARENLKDIRTKLTERDFFLRLCGGVVAYAYTELINDNYLNSPDKYSVPLIFLGGILVSGILKFRLKHIKTKLEILSKVNLMMTKPEESQLNYYLLSTYIYALFQGAAAGWISSNFDDILTTIKRLQ